MIVHVFMCTFWLNLIKTGNSIFLTQPEPKTWSLIQFAHNSTKFHWHLPTNFACTGKYAWLYACEFYMYKLHVHCWWCGQCSFACENDASWMRTAYCFLPAYHACTAFGKYWNCHMAYCFSKYWRLMIDFLLERLWTYIEIFLHAIGIFSVVGMEWVLCLWWFAFLVNGAIDLFLRCKIMRRLLCALYTYMLDFWTHRY
jgi:hypothetical protein